jgi:drug/metabolite transporter (DMT)-like permease
VLVAERLLFRVALRAAATLGIALAATGVVTVVTHGHPLALLALSFNGGDALAFAAMTSWVAYTLLSKRRPVALPPLIGLAALSTGAALMLLPAAVVELLHHVGQPHLGLVLTTRSVSAILFLGLVPSIGAYGSYGRLVRSFGAARAATSMYIVPVFAGLLAALLLGEALHPYHAAGLALILGGVALSACAGRRAVAADRATDIAMVPAR